MQVTDDDIKAVWLKGHNEIFLNVCKGWEKMHPFESRIRRRWWHQNPLQAPQIMAWWQYLDAVAAEDDETALYALHERCLVPCASYPGAFLPGYMHTFLCVIFVCHHQYAMATLRRVLYKLNLQHQQPVADFAGTALNSAASVAIHASLCL